MGALTWFLVLGDDHYLVKVECPGGFIQDVVHSVVLEVLQVATALEDAVAKLIPNDEVRPKQVSVKYRYLEVEMHGPGVPRTRGQPQVVNAAQPSHATV